MITTAAVGEGQAERDYRVAELRLWRSVHGTKTERRVELPRGRGWVRVQEIGAGPTMLFLHDDRAAGAAWIPVVRRIRHREARSAGPAVRCLLPDLPGSALSSRADLTVGLVADLLDACDVDRAYVVASGSSIPLARQAVTTDPDRIEGVFEISDAEVQRGARPPDADAQLWFAALARYHGRRRPPSGSRVPTFSDDLAEWMCSIGQLTTAAR